MKKSFMYTSLIIVTKLCKIDAVLLILQMRNQV